MSSIRRTQRTARAALGASALTLTLLATSACGPDNSSSDTAATTAATAAATSAAASAAATGKA
ncbi:hypothetical protein, partial [Kitasatospora sp. NPDC093558]|uniref:hypothetical protein n=1 Tax=Kitasatospora sp. NPDC093558 TaxID=3155201 RepID=UPI003444210B